MVLNCTGELPNSAEAARALGLATGPDGEILVDDRMRTSVEGVYAAGDVIGAPMEMFKARKCGMTAARNIMGEDHTFDFSQYPDFLHSTYEVTWVGLSEEEARERYDDIAIIRMPPRGHGGRHPAAVRGGDDALRVREAGAVGPAEVRHRRARRAVSSGSTTSATVPRTPSSTSTTCCGGRTA